MLHSVHSLSIPTIKYYRTLIYVQRHVFTICIHIHGYNCSHINVHTYVCNAYTSNACHNLLLLVFSG